jgi:RNA-directed DNA polymerase
MSLWKTIRNWFGGKSSETKAENLPSPTLPNESPISAQPTSIVATTTNPSVPQSAFLPIKREELLTGIREVRQSTGWMFFGRRDIIPPISDPRTALIDRGMVTQGLITPEELQEIHAIGEKYDAIANRDHHIRVKAGQSAEQAVEADRAERARIKAAKKAEFSEKKRQLAEAIRERKQNDITFIGRGVSASLQYRESQIDRLQQQSLPVLQTPLDLSNALGLTIPQLRWLCFHSEVVTRMHYIQFQIPKKSGGMRTLAAPHKKLATAQEWILTNILEKLEYGGIAHGFVPGRSTVTNAMPHVGKAILINVDLENFFPSIHFNRVRKLFRSLGYSGAVATLLALLCTECPRQKVMYYGKTYFVATGERGLPQGACTSPAISNQIAGQLDSRLWSICQKLNVVYTRYADDLSFSGDDELESKIGYLLARIRHIAEDEGFAINPKKTRIQGQNARQVVTGLVVNQTVGVPRDIVRRIRSILHHAKTEGLETQNRDQHPNFRGWLEGMIAYIHMVKPDQAAKLQQQLNEVT